MGIWASGASFGYLHVYLHIYPTSTHRVSISGSSKPTLQAASLSVLQERKNDHKCSLFTRTASPGTAQHCTAHSSRNRWTNQASLFSSQIDFVHLFDAIRHSV